MARETLKEAISGKLCSDAALLKALTDNCYNLVCFLQDLPDANQMDAADAQVQLLITTLGHIQKDIEEAANLVMKLQDAA